MLFADYELTAGQKQFAAANRVGATAEAAAALDGLELVAVPEQDLLANPKKWDHLHPEVTRSGAG